MSALHRLLAGNASAGGLRGNGTHLRGTTVAISAEPGLLGCRDS
ncbi:MAG: hypothetical protein NVV60_13005 [Luteimonas sp.]|nr:hypothetical protein [Luteimonas sp.]